MADDPLVATKHEHLVIARSSGILLFLWRCTDTVHPLLFLYLPLLTHSSKHTLLFLYSCPLMAERKQDQLSLHTDMMRLFCVKLHSDVIAAQATPLLFGLFSDSLTS